MGIVVESLRVLLIKLSSVLDTALDCLRNCHGINPWNWVNPEVVNFYLFFLIDLCGGISRPPSDRFYALILTLRKVLKIVEAKLDQSDSAVSNLFVELFRIFGKIFNFSADAKKTDFYLKVAMNSA